MKISALGLALFLILGMGYAQQPCHLEISGQVLDEHNSEPLAFAQVVIKELNRGTVVDSSGHYLFQNVCPGTYTLVASHIGCKPVSRKLQLKQSRSDFNFYPEHHSEYLSEAVIVESRDQAFEAAVSSLTAEDIEAAQGKSVAEAIEKISGASVVKTGNTITKPVIHGLYGNRILTLNHGVNQQDQQWGLEHGLNIDLYAADQISVVKGAAAVQYGAGAVGGVVKVESNPLPYEQNLSGEAVLQANSQGRGGSASLELAHGLGQNTAVRVQASGKKLGDLRAPRYVLDNTGTEELNGSIELGHRLETGQLKIYYSHYGAELGILSASHIGNLSDLKRAIGRDEPLQTASFSYSIDNPRQLLSHDLLKVEAHHNLSDEWALSANYGYQINQRREFDNRRGGRSDIPSNYLKLHTHSTAVDLKRTRSGGRRSAYGISAMTQINSNVAGTGIRPILPNYNMYQLGVFALEEWQSENWNFELGGRFDFNHTLAQKYDQMGELIKPEFNFSNLALTAAAGRRINDRVKISSLLALAQRSPQVNELLSEGLHHGSASIEEGDLSLQPEQSLNWSTTLDYLLSEKVQIKLTAYLNPFIDYIFLQPQAEPRLTIRGAFPVYQYEQTDVLLAGADLSANWQIAPPFSYSVTAAYLRAKNLSADYELPLIPPGQITQTLSFEIDQPQSRWRGWYAKVSHQYTAYQNYYPLFSTELPELLQPPSAFNLFDLQLGKRWNLKSKQKISFAVEVENILDTSYRNYLNRLRFYADEIGRNFSIQFKFQF